MAFVFRHSKDTTFTAHSHTPGPGIYQQQPPSKPHNPAVGFSNRCPRSIWKLSQNPGPADYSPDHSNAFQNSPDPQRIAFFQQNQGFASSCFKSKSKRLLRSQPSTPGPGSYQIEKKPRGGKRKTMSAKPTKLSNYITSEIRKQSHDGEEKFSNKFMPSEITAKAKDEKQKEDKSKNKSIFFASKVERAFPPRPQTSNCVGPGSYEIAEALSFIDRKPLHLTREAENPLFYEKGRKQQILEPSSHLQKTKEDLKQLGPGSYETEKSRMNRQNPSLSKGIQCFGSMQSRFASSQRERRGATPGPQQYSATNKIEYFQTNQVVKNKVPFNSGAVKDFLYAASTGTMSNIAPGTYETSNNFTELMKKNYLKNPVGSFGSTVDRFKEAHTDLKRDKPSGQNNLIISNPDLEGKGHEKAIEKYSRSRVTKYIEKRIIVKFPEQDPRPLCYDTDHQTLRQKYSHKSQINTPFMIGSKRFNENDQMMFKFSNEQIDSSKVDLSLKSSAKEGKKKQDKARKALKSGTVISNFFKVVNESKDKQNNQGRLLEEKREEATVGPQSYDPVKPRKTQTFNILFKGKQ